MVQKFTTRPATFEAIQYDGTNHEEIIEFTGGKAKYDSAVGSSEDGSGGKQSYSVLTLETEEKPGIPMQAWIRKEIIAEGDYVVRFDSNQCSRQDERTVLALCNPN